MKDIEALLRQAGSAGVEDIKALALHPSSKVVLKVLSDANLTDEIAVIIARRRNIGSDIFEALYEDMRWKNHYPVLLSLCKNPRTPPRIVISLLKSLRIFDLADLTRNRQIPINVRAKAEGCICEKILSMPLGIKITLAKRASIEVLARLLEDGMKEVVAECLNSPFMTEQIVCRIISMKKTASHVVRRIAEHPKWSSRYDVQWALMRNSHTPLACSVVFMKNLKAKDLRELHDSQEVSVSAKPFIYRELRERSETGRIDS
jgi:hypothetical protein